MLMALLAYGLAHAADQARGTFRVWVFSDAHVDTDKRNERESLAIALRQSESTAGFAWDIALDLGDLSGAQGTPASPACLGHRRAAHHASALKHASSNSNECVRRSQSAAFCRTANMSASDSASIVDAFAATEA